MSDDVCLKVVELYLNEKKRGAAGGNLSSRCVRAARETSYQWKAERCMADENCFKVRGCCSLPPTRLGLQGGHPRRGRSGLARCGTPAPLTGPCRLGRAVAEDLSASAWLPPAPPAASAAHPSLPQVMFLQRKGQVIMTIELLDTEEAQTEDPVEVQVRTPIQTLHLEHTVGVRSSHRQPWGAPHPPQALGTRCRSTGYRMSHPEQPHLAAPALSVEA